MDQSLIFALFDTDPLKATALVLLALIALVSLIVAAWMCVPMLKQIPRERRRKRVAKRSLISVWLGRPSGHSDD